MRVLQDNGHGMGSGGGDVAGLFAVTVFIGVTGLWSWCVCRCDGLMELVYVAGKTGWVSW